MASKSMGIFPVMNLTSCSQADQTVLDHQYRQYSELKGSLVLIRESSNTCTKLCLCRRMLLEFIQQVIYTKLEQLKYNLKGYLDFLITQQIKIDVEKICTSVVFLGFLLYSSKFRQWRYESTCRNSKLNERRGDEAWDMTVILVLHQVPWRF